MNKEHTKIIILRDKLVGKHFLLNNGDIATLIEYHNAKNCTIQFEDGVIKHNIFMSALRSGQVKKFENRLGKTNKSLNSGEEASIMEYTSAVDVKLLFKDGTIIKTTYHNFKKGEFENKNTPKIFGVGFLGYGRYKTGENGKTKSSYHCWYNMLARCYDEKTQNIFPTYKGCTVVDEWKCFQVFAEWYENNYKNDFALDKDILFKGNKIYSPKTCRFVPIELNNLFSKNKKGKFLKGVSKKESEKRYTARISKKYERQFEGSFYTEQEAHESYVRAKKERVKELADKWKDLIDVELYDKILEYDDF